jgi:hypothetical protein
MSKFLDTLEFVGPIAAVVVIVGYFIGVNWFKMTGRDVDRETKLFIFKFMLGAAAVGLTIGFLAR